ncbi:MAG: hypothetical protein KA436_11685 [Oligoflexales bacterium]|nr:hypothetical protein [Oligoflexales bacterium]
MSMKVIWKRPDGFHGASPSDFTLTPLSSQAKIWLHKTDSANFPFRLSGGWQDEEATHKLNRLVNLLGKPSADWVSHLLKIYHDSKIEDPTAFLLSLISWIDEVSSQLKGDAWELEIMGETLTELREILRRVQGDFQKKVETGS